MQSKTRRWIGIGIIVLSVAALFLSQFTGDITGSSYSIGSVMDVHVVSIDSTITIPAIIGLVVGIFITLYPSGSNRKP